MSAKKTGVSALPGSVPKGVSVASLALADGTVYEGYSFGAQTVTEGEVIFNTSMMGYQEIVTDPSYAGQIVTMTYTQIGNVGVNGADAESSGPMLSGFVVKEWLDEPSSWRAESQLGAYLREAGIPGMAGLDTRALVRRIRDSGAQVGVISTDPEVQDAAELVARAQAAPGLDGEDWVARVTCSEPYRWDEGTWAGVDGQVPQAKGPTERRRLVAYDFGIKRNILRLLFEQGFDVTVVPATTSAQDALAYDPDAIFLSNGPGDPAAVAGVQENVRELASQKPLFGICLGHQILGLALGGETRKLKFGHHGGNQPGQDLATGKGGHLRREPWLCRGCRLPASEPVRQSTITHVNLNDGTVEGLAHRANAPSFPSSTIPEASPGPHDASYFFRTFSRACRAFAPKAM